MPVLWLCWHSGGYIRLIYCQGDAAIEVQTVNKNVHAVSLGKSPGKSMGLCLFMPGYISADILDLWLIS